jgi:DnaJ-domain-containing protein 1
MKEGFKHLYGVIGAPKNLNFGPIKIGNQEDEVYPVTYKELSAIVSNTPFIDYKTMTKDLLLRSLLDHQKVIERVMDSYATVPFKFGSLARNEKEVKQILTQGHSLFKSLLPWVRERVEFELVATWDREKVFKALYEEESEIRFLQEMIERKSERDALLEKIKLGKLVHECLTKRRFHFKDKILSQLKECPESQCDHDVMDDLMILNMAFLLRKEMEREFDRKVQYLDQTFLGEVCFKLIGPLPLYSFRCIEIEWTDAKEVYEALTLLGLKEDASLDDLKSAYYQKAKSLHPDRMGDRLSSPLEFEKVAKAYRLLKRYYHLYRSLPGEERVPSIEVRTNGSNDLKKRDEEEK